MAEKAEKIMIGFDFRKHEMQERRVREGNALHFEGRTLIHEMDGSITFGDWLRISTIDNYGDCFDPKQSFW